LVRTATDERGVLFDSLVIQYLRFCSRDRDQARRVVSS